MGVCGIYAVIPSRGVVPDVFGYEQFLRNRLSCIDSVVSTNSSFVLRIVKYSTELPLNPPDSSASDAVLNHRADADYRLHAPRSSRRR